MNRNVEEVTITDPYVSNPNQVFYQFSDPFWRILIVNFIQVHNFVSFCETLVVGCENLKSIRLITRPANDLREKDGLKNLELLRQSLFEHSVKLEIELQLGVHLRNIEFDLFIKFIAIIRSLISFSFNNGFVVKIDRGLDLFDSSGGFALGSKNFKLRHCKQTYVEIQKECQLRSTNYCFCQKLIITNNFIIVKMNLSIFTLNRIFHTKFICILPNFLLVQCRIQCRCSPPLNSYPDFLRVIQATIMVIKTSLKTYLLTCKRISKIWIQITFCA